MNAVRSVARHSFLGAASAVTLCLAGLSGAVLSDEIKVKVSGDQEIPPVTTPASGTGIFIVNPDRSISGSVTVTGLTVTAAHIHDAPAGKNGPIVVPLTKISETTWQVPAGAKLTDGQYASYKAGDLYFNMHSAAYKAGEIRGQIKP